MLSVALTKAGIQFASYKGDNSYKRCLKHIILNNQTGSINTPKIKSAMCKRSIVINVIYTNDNLRCFINAKQGFVYRYYTNHCSK